MYTEDLHFKKQMHISANEVQGEREGFTDIHQATRKIRTEIP